MERTWSHSTLRVRLGKSWGVLSHDGPLRRVTLTRNGVGLFWLDGCLPSANLRWQAQKNQGAAHRYQEQIQPVPDTFEILLFQFFYFYQFLDYECNDKEAEGDFTRSQEVIIKRDVSEELHRVDTRGGESTPSGRELHHQPGKNWGLVLVTITLKLSQLPLNCLSPY